jgi:hypothetical protein
MRFLVLVPKLAAAGAAGALLAGGVAAAAPAVASVPVAAAKQPAPRADRAQRVLIVHAVFEAEADVLGMKPEELRAALRSGKTVEQLAAAKGINKDQFADRLTANLKPRLDALVASGKITRAEADRALDRISKGHIPGWNGIHHKKPAQPAENG